MQISIEKDGEGFLAKVMGTDELYAFGFTQQEAIRELSNVIEMVSDTFLPFSVTGIQRRKKIEHQEQTGKVFFA